MGFIENHPEFIWATFEHYDRKSQRLDLAPAAIKLPGETTANTIISDESFPLYAAKTPAGVASIAPPKNSLVLDETMQTVTPATSIYRVFPSSSQDDVKEDEDVMSVNRNVGELFESLGISGDLRNNYRFVGAVWVDDPAANFGPNLPLPKEALAGENGLSNVAMDTQADFPNCFSCHKATGIAGLPASVLNVSHLFSKFYDEQH